MGKSCFAFAVTAFVSLSITQNLAEEICEFGALPGTAYANQTCGFDWRIYGQRCELRHLLPEYAAPQVASQDDPSRKAAALSLFPADDTSRRAGALNGASILTIGDSVDRFTLWDVNETALKAQWPNHTSILREHWRGALKSANLEMVYQFAPGSHPNGPYHDDVSYEFSIVNAIPRGFELHRLLTGRTNPNIVVYSNILWDLGRWLFLSEVAPLNETEYYGLPLLRDAEFLQQELLNEWYNDTHIAMQRIEKYAGKDAVLIYHNAAFPKLRNFEQDGTMHWQTGTGRRTHIIQLNALARQIVSERPRWHLVDFGMMSEAFISGNYLRDPHHPNADFLLQVMDIYLNLHAATGVPMPPRSHTVGDLGLWDVEYKAHGEQQREMYQQEYDEEKAKWHEHQRVLKETPPKLSVAQRIFNRHRMLANLRGRKQ